MTWVYRRPSRPRQRRPVLLVVFAGEVIVKVQGEAVQSSESDLKTRGLVRVQTD